MNNVTILMPYWERFETAKRVIKAWELLEPNSEILVIDDGSPTEPCSYPNTIRLPIKTLAKTPCVPYNIGAAAATTEFILLTGCDIIPQQSLIEQLLSHSEHPRFYAQAKTTNSVTRCEYFPTQFNPNFCCLLRREFFFQCGGFNNIYRDGQAFDDTDFAWRLKTNNARSIQRDDLLCDHIRLGAKSNWPPGGWQRNFKIFQNNWHAER